MFSKSISLFLCLALLSCQTLLPIIEAGHHHGNNDQGLAVLLAAGLLAKILRGHKHEEHHIHIPVPVHHEHHEHHGHHGSGTTRIYVHHPGPFHHIHGGMMTSSSAWNPSMVPRYVYTGAQQMYPPPPY